MPLCEAPDTGFYICQNNTVPWNIGQKGLSVPWVTDGAACLPGTDRSGSAGGPILVWKAGFRKELDTWGKGGLNMVWDKSGREALGDEESDGNHSKL